MALKDKLLAKANGIKTKAEAQLAKAHEETPAPSPAQAPRTAIGQASAFQVAIAAKDREIQEILANKSSTEVMISDLHEIPGRRRNLTEDQFNELKANLASNPLTSPVTVRKRKEGGYELIAGHNRARAYKELGKEKILAVILDLTDDEADRSAFYSNLLAPSLPDFEKYLGLSARIAKKGYTQEQVADESGISRSLVAQLLAFDRLPREALELLRNAPDKSVVGAAAAQKFVTLSSVAGKGRVVDAIRKLVAGELSQAAALAHAAESEKKSSKSAPIVIRQGKKTYCSIIRTPKDLRLSFGNQEHLDDELVEAVQSLVEGWSKRVG